ncbi:type II toxin-antitoxin system Phd/YefM family antitoxin [bacterium]|nr:type II toxin-antitoxin system Phd/YefM family antitoxin [bacterium]
MYTYSISEARAKFADVIKASRKHVVQITDRNRPAVAILDWDEYESLLETMELLSDSEAMKEIREGIKDAQAGRTVSLEAAKKDLGLL